MKKIKIIAGVTLGLLIAGAAGAAFMYGSGGATIVAPADAAIKVSVDGKEVGSVDAGGHHKFSLEQGEHTVTLTSATGTSSEYKLKIENGAFDQVLPVGKQCFALFDVTNYWYEKKKLLDKLGAEIVVKEKYADARPFDMPSGAHFSTDELPKSIKSGERAKVLLEVPCKLLSGSEKELLSETFN